METHNAFTQRNNQELILWKQLFIKEKKNELRSF